MDTFAVAKLPPNPKNATMASYGDDSTINALFEDIYILNEAESKITGRSVEEHRVQITLEYPGNNLNNFKIIFHLEEGDLGNEWTQRFPRQWQAYRNQRAQVPNGTPLEVWAALDKRRVLGMKAQNIHTVEQIAALSDATGPMLGMDWRKIRDMANTYLKPEAGMQAVSRLNAENEDLKNRLGALEALLHTKQEPLDAPKKRGPKPKLKLEEAQNGDSA